MYEGRCLFLILAAAGCAPSGTGGPPGRSSDGPDPDFEIRLAANAARAGTADAETLARLSAARGPAVPILCEMLRAAAPEDRDRLAAILSSWKDERAVPALVDVLSTEAPAVRAALTSICGTDLGPGRKPWILWWEGRQYGLSEGERKKVREAFLIQPVGAQQEILRTLARELERHTMLVHRDPFGKTGALSHRSGADAPEELRRRYAAIPILEAVLEQGIPENLLYVSLLALQIGGPAVEPLRRALHSPHVAARTAAARALGEIGLSETGEATWERLLADADAGVRVEAARALERAGTERDWRLLERMAESDPAYAAAIVTLAIRDPPRHAPRLLRYLARHEDVPLLRVEISRWVQRHYADCHLSAPSPEGSEQTAVTTEDRYLAWLREEGLLERRGREEDLTLDSRRWNAWWERHKACGKRSFSFQ